jgi:hypothetical protein
MGKMYDRRAWLGDANILLGRLQAKAILLKYIFKAERYHLHSERHYSQH